MSSATDHDYPMHAKQRAADTAKRPSTRQRYCIAHLMTDLLGLEWPETSAQASAQIGDLKAALEAAKQNGGSTDDCPL